MWTKRVKMRDEVHPDFQHLMKNGRLFCLAALSIFSALITTRRKWCQPSQRVAPHPGTQIKTLALIKTTPGLSRRLPGCASFPPDFGTSPIGSEKRMETLTENGFSDAAMTTTGSTI